MSNVDLKRFVDVDITSHVSSVLSGTRDTVVIFAVEKVDDEAGEVLLTSSQSAAVKFGVGSSVEKMARVFFDNNPSGKIFVKYGMTTVAKSDIEALPNEYVLLTTTSGLKDSMKTAFVAYSTDPSVYGVNRKLYLRQNTLITGLVEEPIDDCAAKYSSVDGAEMTMAAYLTKLDVYAMQSVKDYMFTVERIEAESIDDVEYATIINNNGNVDINLASAVRNCGGNLLTGEDLVNAYVRIILHQTLTARLIDLLTQKIKGTTGVSKIYNVICQELNHYVDNGYLVTDKLWTDDDLVKTYNGRQYTIIGKGTPITAGYVVKVLPFEALTDIDKAARKAPLIYVILAEQYGIRKITISGEAL